MKTSWQRQTMTFGHDQGDKYSSLILDNRGELQSISLFNQRINHLLGMGKSDKPLMRYSTSEMALDVIEVIDHLGWTEERQLHITGVSMGGMIAQEIAI